MSVSFSFTEPTFPFDEPNKQIQQSRQELILRTRDGGELLCAISFLRLNARSLTLSEWNDTSIFADKASIKNEGTSLVEDTQKAMDTQFLALPNQPALDAAKQKYAYKDYKVRRWMDLAPQAPGGGSRYETVAVTGLFAFGQAILQAMWRCVRLVVFWDACVVPKREFEFVGGPNGLVVD